MMAMPGPIARIRIFAFAIFLIPLIAAAAPQEMTWDDLMPEGEFEKLDEMYADYMAELERQMRASSRPLSQTTPDMVAEGSDLDQMEQIGTFNTVEALDGADIRLPGYVVPFDFDSGNEYSEFLLVPYFGACIHSPPPPPNQIVYVKTKKPVTVENIWSPVWVEGRLTTEKNLNDTGDAAYTLDLKKVEPY